MTFTQKNLKGKKTIVFVLGWGVKKELINPITFIYSHLGYHTIAIDIDKESLSSDLAKTRDLIKSESEKILALLESINNKEVVLHATSLGTVVISNILTRLPNIKNIILNTTGSKISKTVWSWNPRKSLLRKELDEDNTSLEILTREWENIETINTLKNISDRKFLIYLSKSDEIIPYSLGIELATYLKDKNSVKLINLKIFNHFY